MVLPDIKHELPAEINENKETMKEPEKIQDPVQTPAPTKEPDKEEKNTPVAVLSLDPVVVPGNKPVAKPLTALHSLKTAGFWYIAASLNDSRNGSGF